MGGGDRIPPGELSPSSLNSRPLFYLFAIYFGVLGLGEEQGFSEKDRGSRRTMSRRLPLALLGRGCENIFLRLVENIFLRLVSRVVLLWRDSGVSDFA